MELSRSQLFKFVIFFVIGVLPSLSVANGNSCRSLFVSSEFDGGIFSDTAAIERPQLLTPWVKSKTTVVKSKGVTSEQLQNLEQDLLELQQLSHSILAGQQKLNARQVQEKDAFFSASISQFLAHHGVTHEVSEFTTLTGRKIFKIRILTPREGAALTPMSHLADRLDAMQADLVFSVNLSLSYHGEAAVLPSANSLRKQTSWATGAINELLFPIPKHRAMLNLPIYALIHPEYAGYSPVVNHEIHHIETLHKLKRGLPFAFYGSIEFGKLFSFLDLFYAYPPVIQAMNAGYKGMKLDEAPAMAKMLMEIKSSLRHKDSEYYESETGEDRLIHDLSYIGGMTKATNQVSKIVATEVIRWSQNKAEEIKFDVRDNIVFAQMILIVEKKGKRIEINLNIPLVEARASHSKAQKIESLKKQMQFMVTEADRNIVLGSWCESFIELRLKEEFDGPGQHELAMIFAQTLYQENDLNVTNEQYQQNLQSRFNTAVQQWRQAHPGWRSN